MQTYTTLIKPAEHETPITFFTINVHQMSAWGQVFFYLSISINLINLHFVCRRDKILFSLNTSLGYDGVRTKGKSHNSHRHYLALFINTISWENQISKFNVRLYSHLKLFFFLNHIFHKTSIGFLNHYTWMRSVTLCSWQFQLHFD